MIAHISHYTLPGVIVNTYGRRGAGRHRYNVGTATSRFCAASCCGLALPASAFV